MDISKEQQKMALFNSALGVTIRINGLLNKCVGSAMNLDAYSWYHSLRGIQRNIWAKMDKEERKQTTEILQGLVKELYVWQSNVERGNVAMPDKLYEGLDEAEKRLQEIADLHDLLIPEKKTIIDFMNVI